MQLDIAAIRMWSQLDRIVLYRHVYFAASVKGVFKNHSERNLGYQPKESLLRSQFIPKYIFLCLRFSVLFTWLEQMIIIDNHRKLVRQSGKKLKKKKQMKLLLLLLSWVIIIVGQGESVLCNFAKRAPIPKRIDNPEKEELKR